MFIFNYIVFIWPKSSSKFSISETFETFFYYCNNCQLLTIRIQIRSNTYFSVSSRIDTKRIRIRPYWNNWYSSVFQRIQPYPSVFFLIKMI